MSGCQAAEGLLGTALLQLSVLIAGNKEAEIAFSYIQDISMQGNYVQGMRDEIASLCLQLQAQASATPHQAGGGFTHMSGPFAAK